MRTALFATAFALAATPAARGAEHLVVMRDMAYEPSRLRAEVGDTIRFVNRDEADHDVFVPTVGHAVDLGKQAPGEERTLVLGREGRFEVECVFHPPMHLVVEVAR